MSQLVIRAPDKSASANEILRLLETVTGLWTAQVNNDGAILDDKLADYVFFPLTHLLRNQDQYPVRVTEACIRLLRELVQHGWKAKISQKLSQQLLIFLSLIIGGAPGQTSAREIPEETILEAYRTLGPLLKSTASSALRAPATAEEQTISALGHSVTVVLDGLTGGLPPVIKLEALQCLQVVYTSIQDNALLARFLPGTVSSLSKLLSPPLAHKTQKRVIVSCLEVLNLVLVTVLGDLKVRGALKEMHNKTEVQVQPIEPEKESAETELTASWLKATAAQIKIALSAVLKLRNHESEEIQSALNKFCISLLDECHSSLADCQSILVESAMMVENEEVEKSMLQTSLQDLAGVYPELADSIKTTLYNWVTGLPRLMQSADDRVRQLAIRNILRGTRLAAAMGMDSSMLNDSLGDALKDSIVSLVKGSKPTKVVDDIGADAIFLQAPHSSIHTCKHTIPFFSAPRVKEPQEQVSLS